jgi:hypothetical protein
MMTANVRDVWTLVNEGLSGLEIGTWAIKYCL